MIFTPKPWSDKILNLLDIIVYVTNKNYILLDTHYFPYSTLAPVQQTTQQKQQKQQKQQWWLNFKKIKFKKVKIKIGNDHSTLAPAQQTTQNKQWRL